MANDTCTNARPIVPMQILTSYQPAWAEGATARVAMSTMQQKLRFVARVRSSMWAEIDKRSNDLCESALIYPTGGESHVRRGEFRQFA